MILLQDSGHASEGITFIIAWVHHSITQLHHFIVTYIYITLSGYHLVISFITRLYHFNPPVTSYIIYYTVISVC